MSEERTAEIVYLPRWRPGGSRLGIHRGRDAGGSGTFRDQVPFLRLPDARRIDLRASLRDPFEGIHVRRFEARTAIEVWVLVDLSGSMAFRGGADRMRLAGDLCRALAASATRVSDGFGLIGCDEGIRADLHLRATRHRSAALATAARVETAPCGGASAAGMLREAARLLAGRPKLVFVASDFRWPEVLIGEVFAALAPHDTVPVLLADEAEGEGLPSFGLVELADLEGAGRRLVMLTPRLRRAWIARERARIEALERTVAPYARRPFHLSERFEAEALTRHLMLT